jgi:hypothetical protein
MRALSQAWTAVAAEVRVYVDDSLKQLVFFVLCDSLMFALLNSSFVSNGVKENFVPMYLVKHHVIITYEGVEV